MAQIVCCTLDVWLRWWDCRDGGGRAERWHTLLAPVDRHSVGYVHKGWTLLARTVPEHIHFDLQDTTEFSVTFKKFFCFKNKRTHRMKYFVLSVNVIRTSERIWFETKLTNCVVRNADLIGTHCSWEELHLSQVLVTTQMIRRYYWNLWWGR